MERKEIERRAISAWLERPVELRLQKYTEDYGYEETWNAGLKLDRDRNQHYQMVMGLIWTLITG